MPPLDAAPIDEDVVIGELEPFLVPGHEENCRAKIHDVVSAVRKGGDTLASMTHSIGEGLDGLHALQEMDDPDGIAFLRFTHKLAEICGREQQRELQRIAESN